jgi:hypothetical protein
MRSRARRDRQTKSIAMGAANVAAANVPAAVKPANPAILAVAQRISGDASPKTHSRYVRTADLQQFGGTQR